MILLFLLMINLSSLSAKRAGVSLEDKERIVFYLGNQNKDEKFNLSYELPLGWNNGYNFLFNYYGKKLTDSHGGGHLYTVMTNDDEQKSGQTVFRTGILILKRR